MGRPRATNVTRNALRLTRERAAEWPLFGGIDLPGVEVLSVVARRAGGEPLAAATARAGRVVRDALRAAPGTVEPAITVLVAGHDQRLDQRVATLFYRRRKVWQDLEEAGLTLPAGTRTEQEVTREPGTIRFVGAIHTELSQLVAALEVTRTRHALCLAGPWSDTTFWELASASDRASALLRTCVATLARETLVLRASGGFDDREASADVFTGPDRADALEAALRRSLPEST